MQILEFVFNCIYLLSFHEDNKESIMSNGVIVHALHNCSSMNNKNILIDAHGTLWELKDKKSRVPMKHKYMRSKSMKSKKATLPKLRKKSRSHSELEWNENQQLPNAKELSGNYWFSWYIGTVRVVYSVFIDSRKSLRSEMLLSIIFIKMMMNF